MYFVGIISLSHSFQLLESTQRCTNIRSHHVCGVTYTYSTHNASVKIFLTNYRLKILVKSNIHISLSLNIEWRKTINYHNKCYSALLEFLVKNNVNKTGSKSILKQGQAEKAY